MDRKRRKIVKRTENAAKMVNLDDFAINPGLQHLARNILVNLDPQSLENCRLVSKSLKQFIENDKVFTKQRFQAVILSRNMKLKQLNLHEILSTKLQYDKVFEGLIGQMDFNEILGIFRQFSAVKDKVNFYPEYRWTPLHHACRFGHNEMVYYSLKHYMAEVMIKTHGNTEHGYDFGYGLAITISFRQKNLEALQYMLDYIMHNSRSNFSVILREFIEECLDYDHEYEGFLKLIFNQPEMKNVLRYLDMEQIFEHVCRTGNSKIIDYVLGYLLDKTDPIEKFSKYYFLDACRERRTKVVHVFLTHPFIKNIIDIDVTDYTGLTPFFYACIDGDLIALQSILDIAFSNDITINFDRQDRWGETALHKACAYGQTEVVKILSNHSLTKSSLDLNIRNYMNSTPLHYACESGYIETIKAMLHFCLDRNVDINAVDDKGHTAFTYACSQGKLDIVEIFYNNSITKSQLKINITDNTGRTPLDYATANGYTKIAQYLSEMSK